LVHTKRLVAGPNRSVIFQLTYTRLISKSRPYRTVRSELIEGRAGQLKPS
jgi:hypothetical protein